MALNPLISLGVAAQSYTSLRPKRPATGPAGFPRDGAGRDQAASGPRTEGEPADESFSGARTHRPAAGPRFAKMTADKLPLLGGLKGAERRVADGFVATCNSYRSPGRRCTASHAAIARAADVSVRTVKYALASMETAGALAVEHDWGRGKR